MKAILNAIKLDTHPIGPGHPPLIVAELSANHGQDLDRALRIVDAVAAAGAHAIKLQTYTADTMTLDLQEGEFFIADPESPWNGQSLYALYRQAQTPWEWHAPLFERARQHGLMAFSTPFDASAVDFLETLDPPCYKIASFENGDLPLIRRVAATGKPIILSTGMATLAELAAAVDAARQAGCADLILLKCTSSYPAVASEANLLTIPHLAALFKCPVGLSDHSLDPGVAIASVALGAAMIEKHVTLSRADGDLDGSFSLEPAELAGLVRNTRLAWEALGRIHYGPTASEQASRRYRRSLYITRDLRAGDRLTPDNLRAIRPGLGLPPDDVGRLLGRRVNRDVRRGTPASWDLLE
ncbi:pseudaminic acid synthase [Thiocystis violacea]|uniref:pseudaminic acid synthase n=1 Tax=Thiocystis violacea TaxID=13725 RepID=UPI00190554B6|nr:pseudaminic acid synthase [Thiocystis violacea]MBK1719495.1 pseudaminic acid synthase [Thiocystis violacea]